MTRANDLLDAARRGRCRHRRLRRRLPALHAPPLPDHASPSSPPCSPACRQARPPRDDRGPWSPTSGAACACRPSCSCPDTVAAVLLGPAATRLAFFRNSTRRRWRDRRRDGRDDARSGAVRLALPHPARLLRLRGRQHPVPPPGRSSPSWPRPSTSRPSSSTRRARPSSSASDRPLSNLAAALASGSSCCGAGSGCCTCGRRSAAVRAARGRLLAGAVVRPGLSWLLAAALGRRGRVVDRRARRARPRRRGLPGRRPRARPRDAGRGGRPAARPGRATPASSPGLSGHTLGWQRSRRRPDRRPHGVDERGGSVHGVGPSTVLGGRYAVQRRLEQLPTRRTLVGPRHHPRARRGRRLLRRGRAARRRRPRRRPPRRRPRQPPPGAGARRGPLRRHRVLRRGGHHRGAHPRPDPRAGRPARRGGRAASPARRRPASRPRARAACTTSGSPRTRSCARTTAPSRCAAWPPPRPSPPTRRLDSAARPASTPWASSPWRMPR